MFLNKNKACQTLSVIQFLHVIIPFKMFNIIVSNIHLEIIFNFDSGNKSMLLKHLVML